MRIHKLSFLRKIVLPLFKRLNPGTIKIKHHFTGKPFYLDAFMHKGYWFHGKNREAETMQLFADLIAPGSTVIEVGAHIGYISLFFSKLVAPNGRVIVFEPGYNNLPYLKKNTGGLPNFELIEKAVSNSNGKALFFVESITGQNNSLLPNYDGFDQNAREAGLSSAKKSVEVETTTLDTFARTLQPGSIDFIKIDIEGAEIMALKGMTDILATIKPTMMIEVSENHGEVFRLLDSHSYQLFDANRSRVRLDSSEFMNLFCIHESNKPLLKKMGH